MAITNLTHSCVIMTAERQVVGGVYWRVRAGCIPNCSARRVIDAMASNPREGAAPAPGADLLFADTAIVLSLLYCLDVVMLTGRSIVMAAPSALQLSRSRWRCICFCQKTKKSVAASKAKTYVGLHTCTYERFGLAYMYPVSRSADSLILPASLPHALH